MKENNEQKNIRILFLVSDTGGTHRNYAKAIISALKEISDNNLHTIIIDFFSLTNKGLDKKIKNFYSKSVRKTSIAHGILFHITNNKYVWNALKPLSNIIYKNLKKRIMYLRPDIIISIHPLVNYITKKILSDTNLKIPFIIAIADLITIHESWIEPNADFFIVPTKSAEQTIIKKNIDKKKIKLMGFAVRPVFYLHKINKSVIRDNFGLKNKFTVLLTGGGEGAGNILPIVKILVTSG